jgi:hypothetical protein
MPPIYSWLQLSTAVAQLAQRLNDPDNTLYPQNECVIYIQQSLRLFNCLTFTWKTDFVFSSSNLWNSLGSLTGSPRLRTQTDVNCYTQMQMMLFEPPSGGVWNGTNQFNIMQFSQALQLRRDEMIQLGNLNQVLLENIALTPNTRRTFLPDNVLDMPRARYLGLQATTTGTASSGASSISVTSTAGIATGQIVSGSGMAYGTTVSAVGSGSVSIAPAATGAVSGTLQFFAATTLFRDDTIASEFYEAPLYQQPPGTPTMFSLSSEPPLSFDVDIAPTQPGTYEAITLESGTPFNPPSATLLNIPDDFTWALIYGALGDLLDSQPESLDPMRAQWCKKRYADGLMLLQKIPWIMLGNVNGVAVNCDSIFATDRYMPNWDSQSATFGPVIVTGGVDFLAAPVGQGIGVTCLGNAPVPVNASDYVQVDRADWDTVLDLAQALACFKQGGADWQQGLELEARAIQACAAENARLRSFGAFSDILIDRGQQQDRDRNRFNERQGKK